MACRTSQRTVTWLKHMADAVTAQWHGHNYQSRVFWLNAFDLLIPETCVREVTFEANGPKSFDDVVVVYDPPVARSGPERIAAEYHQIKWHVQTGGRFGYMDLTDPKFIGATRYSLLERLKAAKETAVGPCRFLLVTPDRIADGDPLGRLISGNDRSLLVERLFDGTTDASHMGKVRKCWREHLALADDTVLQSIVEGLSIVEGYRSLQELRQEINLKAVLVGLKACNDAESDFRYDELARQLKIRGINAVTSDSLLKICREEGLWVGDPPQSEFFLPVAIRSFLGLSTDVVPAAPDNTLLLTDNFRQRYLHDDRDWQCDIRPRVEAFLCSVASRSSQIQLILDTHASIAFLAGCVLDLKSSIRVELVQKGRVGSRTWRADDGTDGDRLDVKVDEIGDGRDIVVAVALTQPVEGHVRRYIEPHLPQVGRVATFTPPAGPGQQSVKGGQHASELAEQVSNSIREMKTNDPDAVVHIFAACPNSFLFYLGQNHQGIGPVVVYEFDFDRQGDKTYQPSFVID